MVPVPRPWASIRPVSRPVARGDLSSRASAMAGAAAAAQRVEGHALFHSMRGVCVTAKNKSNFARVNCLLPSMGSGQAALLAVLVVVICAPVQRLAGQAAKDEPPLLPANATFRFSCTTPVSTMDAQAFGRGYSKEVWRATAVIPGSTATSATSSNSNDNTSNRWQLVLKRPAESARRFVHDAQNEFAAAQLLRNQADPALAALARRHVLQVYGVCLPRQQEAAEGGLAKLLFVGGQAQLPWCARLDLARQMLDILHLLHGAGLMHCDLKTDQVLVDVGATLRLVDLDTLSPVNRPRFVYGPRQSCSSDSACRQSCLKHSASPTSDTRCDPATRRCLPLDVDQSLLQLVATAFFPVLVPNATIDTAFPPRLAPLWRRAVGSMTAESRAERWHLADARAFFTELWDLFPIAKYGHS